MDLWIELGAPVELGARGQLKTLVAILGVGFVANLPNWLRGLRAFAPPPTLAVAPDDMRVLRRTRRRHPMCGPLCHFAGHLPSTLPPRSADLLGTNFGHFAARSIRLQDMAYLDTIGSKAWKVDFLITPLLIMC